MEYKIRFKRLEEGSNPEENYEALGNGLQCQRGEGASMEVLLSTGVLLGKLASGHAQEMVVPEGKTLEVIYKD